MGRGSLERSWLRALIQARGDPLYHRTLNSHVPGIHASTSGALDRNADRHPRLSHVKTLTAFQPRKPGEESTSSRDQLRVDESAGWIPQENPRAFPEHRP